MSAAGIAAAAVAPTITFSGLWDDLKAEAKALVQAAIDEGKKLEATIVPLIESDAATILSQFKTLAIQTVISLGAAELSALSGQEKQSTVVTTVYQAAQAAGKQIAIQDVRMFAQQAYNAVATQLVPKP